eukprot:TRINITY_DN3877_c1_g2_i2.p1 TRINITY_DN3877_c1_g2~~TRINITY_DN3877_c1_g2_i2.p1  ORF type:complete len:312 (-),score=61.86 TRINITY_DN3877_c1_g2_i2:606-1541(-)
MTPRRFSDVLAAFAVDPSSNQSHSHLTPLQLAPILPLQSNASNSQYNPQHNPQYNPQHNPQYNLQYNSQYNSQYNIQYNPQQNPQHNPQYNLQYNIHYTNMPIQKSRHEHASEIQFYATTSPDTHQNSPIAEGFKMEEHFRMKDELEHSRKHPQKSISYLHPYRTHPPPITATTTMATSSTLNRANPASISAASSTTIMNPPNSMTMAMNMNMARTPTTTHTPPSAFDESRTKAKAKNQTPRSDKRPLNAYILFCAEWRERLRKQNPFYSTTELAAALGEAWRNLSQDAKSIYYTRATCLKSGLPDPTIDH